VWARSVQKFPQFLFGLEVELLTAAFRPTRRVPELIGAKGDVWHFWHSIIQLNLANFWGRVAARGARLQVQLPYQDNVPIGYIRVPRFIRCLDIRLISADAARRPACRRYPAHLELRTRLVICKTTTENPMLDYPRPPFAGQKQPMPGSTDAMQPRPDHGEKSYKGSGRLKGMKAVITGGDSGIGRAWQPRSREKAPMS
jgi:hypothetical protein